MSTATVMPMTTASDLPLDQSNQIEDDVVTIGRNEFEPAITNEQFQEYERTQDDAWGTKRRIALISLSRCWRASNIPQVCAPSEYSGNVASLD